MGITPGHFCAALDGSLLQLRGPNWVITRTSLRSTSENIRESVGVRSVSRDSLVWVAEEEEEAEVVAGTHTFARLFVVLVCPESTWRWTGGLD